jgi:hypothetical protein
VPWKSAAQRRWGNSPSGHAALGDKGVDEWNAASKGMKLPEKKGVIRRAKERASGKHSND